MNASYFVLVAASLTFATGFFVATIVWSIKWLLLPKEETLSRVVHLLHLFSWQTMKGIGVSRNDNSFEDMANKDLYLYFHGNENSGSTLASVSNESINNKELYRYNHGRN